MQTWPYRPSLEFIKEWTFARDFVLVSAAFSASPVGVKCIIVFNAFSIEQTVEGEGGDFLRAIVDALKNFSPMDLHFYSIGIEVGECATFVGIRMFGMNGSAKFPHRGDVEQSAVRAILDAMNSIQAKLDRINRSADVQSGL